MNSTAENTAVPRRTKVWTAGTLTYSLSGIIILFCWLLLGDFAWSMKERSVYNITQLLFKTFGASDMVNALCMGTLPSLIILILGPLVSYHSDRKRGGWGRRIPYLLVTTPIASLSMIGLAFCPLLGTKLHLLLVSSSPGQNSLIIGFMAICWLAFEVGTITANTIFTALINDVVPDTLVGRFYGLFRMFSLLAGIIFNFWLLGKAEKYYVLMFVIIGLIYGVGFLLMCFKVKEGEYPPPEAGGKGAFDGIRIYFKDCFHQPYYCVYFVFLTLSGLVFTPVNLFSVFQAQSLNISMTDYGHYIAFTFIISLVLSWFIGVLADRIHPLRLGIGILVLYAISGLLSGLLITNQTTFAVAIITHCVISGMFFTGTASLGQRMLPKDRFAQLAAAGGVIGSIATVMITPLIGGVLDLSHHCYRLTYLMGSGFALLSLIPAIWVYRKFMALGGDDNYQAP